MSGSYNGVGVPSDGKKIGYASGKYEVPDNPIIPFIEGDGTGRDIWKASQRVFDAAVEKAYGGKRKVAWYEVLAGEKSYRADAELAAGRYGEGDDGLSRVHQRTADDAGGRRHSLAECGAAAVDGSVSVHSAGEVLRRRAQPGEASGEARRGDLPREYRGHLCGHRVPRRERRRRRR
jgi:hypothetical protein